MKVSEINLDTIDSIKVDFSNEDDEINSDSDKLRSRLDSFEKAVLEDVEEFSGIKLVTLVLICETCLSSDVEEFLSDYQSLESNILKALEDRTHCVTCGVCNTQFSIENIEITEMS